MKQKNYTIEEIFEKDLLFLIPFYIFSYEKQLPEYDRNKTKLEELKQEYGHIRTKLEELSRDKHIDEYTKCTILDMAKRVLENIAKKYKNIMYPIRWTRILFIFLIRECVIFGSINKKFASKTKLCKYDKIF